MRAKIMAALICAVIVSSIATFASEGVSEQSATKVETEVRDYNPEQGTGWMTAKVNDTSANLEYTGSTKGMTGTMYSFEGDGFEVNLMFNKKLEAGEEMDENAIIQIEVISSNHDSIGYYFTKKSSKTKVESNVLLSKEAPEGIMQGEFSVTVPSADRYVGDNKPGILEKLEFTEGEFGFFE